MDASTVLDTIGRTPLVPLRRIGPASGARILLTVGDFLDTNYVEALRDQDLPALERIVTFRDAAEGIGAVTEKRPPAWEDR